MKNGKKRRNCTAAQLTLRTAVSLTLKTVSVLSAVALMTTLLGGCALKKNNKESEKEVISSTMVSEADDKIKDTGDVTEKDNSKDDSKELDNSDKSEIEKDNTENNLQTKNDNQGDSNKQNSADTSGKNNVKDNKKDNNTNSNTGNNNTNNSSNTNNNASNNNTNSNTNNNNNSQTPSQDTPSSSIENEFIVLTPNNVNDVKTFKSAVLDVAKDTRGTFGGIWRYKYNGEVYTSFGVPSDEFTYILAYFNKDYITDETLRELLKGYSEDDFKRFPTVLATTLMWVKGAKIPNDWNDLIIDKKIAQQLINVEKGYLEYCYNDDSKLLKSMLKNEDSYNPFVKYYLGYAGIVMGDPDQQIDYEVVDLAYPLYDKSIEELDELAANTYNFVHGK